MMLEFGPKEISIINQRSTLRDRVLEIDNFLSLRLRLQLLLIGQPHKQILRLGFGTNTQPPQKLALKP